MAYVLDASAAVDLLLETSAGALLRPELPAGEAWVPELFFPEVGSAIRRLEMRGSITMARADSAVGDLLDARLRRVQVKPLLPEAWALRHRLTIADAVYVVLAKHLRIPVVTTDRGLASAPGIDVATITV